MDKTLTELDAAYRVSLRQLLAQCTDAQQRFFKRMYPMGIDKMTEQQIRRAIQQCEATIKKNTTAQTLIEENLNDLSNDE